MDQSDLKNPYKRSIALFSAGYLIPDLYLKNKHVMLAAQDTKLIEQ